VFIEANNQELKEKLTNIEEKLVNIEAKLALNETEKQNKKRKLSEIPELESEEETTGKNIFIDIFN
jgi:cob(I)alamin adenosyltransferase